MRFQVLVDRSERINKCTILPLAGHRDLDILRYNRGQPLAALTGQLLLHPDGQPLDLWRRTTVPATTVPTLSAIDCTWKRLHTVLNCIAKPLPTLVGIPAGFVTAYPRRNKQDKDPDAGLATIEAVFIAAALLGHWDTSLLGHYAFAEAFLRQNKKTFEHYIAAPVTWPFAIN
jgi:pre-rRNA-processing protein TSR3